MKLTNYQKIMVTWAIFVSAGYIASIWIFLNEFLFFAVWFAIGIIGIVMELKLGGWPSFKEKLIQLVWVVVVIGGIALNILERNGTIPLFGNNSFIGWPLTCAFGMLITSIIYRLNVSYLILMALYGVFAGVVFMISDFTIGLVVSAMFFAALFLVDAGFEGTKFRFKSLLPAKRPS